LCQPAHIFATVEQIRQRVQILFAEVPEARAAILVRENKQGQFLAKHLKDLEAHGILVYEVGQRDRHSQVPGEILALLQFLQRPHSPDLLKKALQVLRDRQLIKSQDFNAWASVPEQFLYPAPLDTPPTAASLEASHLSRSLLRARLELPSYELISFLAFTLAYEQAELATADKLAQRLFTETRGDRSLEGLVNALAELVSSEQFEPVETEGSEERYTRRGQLTIITMHKAKGLDWDYVFIPFLHEQTIPGRLRIPPQTQFLGDFTLSEVARAQIRAHLHGQDLPDIGTAWQRAGYLKTAEEYRLLYVAMTRAKQLLWMAAEREAPFSWNQPEKQERKAPCPAWSSLVQAFPHALVQHNCQNRSI
jgi:DNA helicase-2/ATP-dependent DNA helicase PcrA